MRAPATSFRYKIPSLLAVAALMLGLVPAFGGQAAVADEADDAEEALVLASLMASGAGRISAAVALEDDPEPVVGSFTVDGLCCAIVGEGEVALVAVGPGSASSGEDSGSGAPASPSPSPKGASSDGSEGEEASEPAALDVPESVEHDGAVYSVSSIGPRAFAGCDADVVRIPAAVASVDEAAFRGSSVGAVEVAEDSPSFSSYDGMLFDADMTSLLLVPEGKQGAARIPKAAEVVPADAFSHCASVTAIEADAGSAAFSSRNGCLYDASGEALVASPPAIDAMRALGARAADNIHATADGTIYHYYDDACTQLHSSGSSGREPGPSRYKLTANLHWKCVKDYPGYWPWYAKSPTRTLVGWSPYADGRVLIPVGATMSTYDNVYAIFGWRVAWDANGGEVDPATSPAEDGQPVASPVPTREGYRCLGWFTAPEGGELACEPGGQTPPVSADVAYHAQWEALSYLLSFDPNGGSGGPGELEAAFGGPLPDASGSLPSRPGHSFVGWFDALEGGQLVYGPQGEPALGSWDRPSGATLYAHWEEQAGIRISYDLGSEPGGGEAGSWPEGAEPPASLAPDAGLVALPEPVRAGYVLAGWSVKGHPGASLLSRGEGGAWLVDSSELPGCAGEGGAVVLVARWTAKVDVEAPLSATFLYDLAQDGAAESSVPKDAWSGDAEGASLLRNRSAVPARVCGMASVAAEGASVLVGPGGATLAEAAAGGPRVLSVFPTTDPSTGTRADAEGAASDGEGDDLSHKVDLALGSTLLEGAFASSPDGSPDAARRAARTVPAASSGLNGVPVPGSLKLGFRLNLGGSTGAAVDRPALLAATGGDATGTAKVPIARLAYCFALERPSAPPPTGDIDDPFYIDNRGVPLGVGEDGVYGTQDILDAALDLAEHADRPEESAYYDLYRTFMGNQGVASYDASTRQTTFQEGPFFKLRIGSELHEVRVLGICQDRLATPYEGESGASIDMTGLTFGWKVGYIARLIDPLGTETTNWSTCDARKYLNGTFRSSLPLELRRGDGIKTVVKVQNGTTGYVDKVDESQDQFFLPSAYEIYGTTIYTTKWGTQGPINPLESAENSFQYQYFALGGVGSPNLQASLAPLPSALHGSYWSRSCFVEEKGDGAYLGYNKRIGVNDDGSMWLPWSLNLQDAQLLPCFAI